MRICSWKSRLLRWEDAKVELWSALTALAWSNWLFWHNNALYGSISYAVTIKVLNENRWELAAVLTGLTQIAAVTFGLKWARITACGVAGWFWITLGYSFFLSGSTAPGSILFLGWGCANLHAMSMVIRRKLSILDVVDKGI